MYSLNSSASLSSGCDMLCIVRKCGLTFLFETRRGDMSRFLAVVAGGVCKTAIFSLVVRSAATIAGFARVRCGPALFSRRNVQFLYGCVYTTLNAFASLSASSIHCANSTAFARVRFDSVRSFRRALSLRRPHTRRSRSASSRNAPNSQDAARRRSSAMYSATFSDGCCLRRWKW